LWKDIVHVAPVMYGCLAASLTFWYIIHATELLTGPLSNRVVATYIIYIPAAWIYFHTLALSMSLFTYLLLRPPRWRSTRKAFLYVGVALTVAVSPVTLLIVKTLTP
jgi:hypothetical protein